MVSITTIIKHIPHALKGVFLNGLGKKDSGKVRDIYVVDNKRILITTDRQSAFDRNLGLIPFKGQVLTLLSEFWFNKTKDIVPNHLISIPHPNVSIVKNCTPITIEMVVRGYITGVTTTSIWYSYERGERVVYGIKLPGGLKKNQKLRTPIITPTTHGGGKGGHDERLTEEDIIKRKLVDPKIYKQMKEAALQLFQRGTEICKKAGLILVDTKYEFGLRDGKLMLMDEIHTPDSSRFWIEKTYKERFEKGLEPENFDKEILRLWFVNKGYRGDGVSPKMPPEFIAKVSRRYISVYEKLTGNEFKPDMSKIDESVIPEFITNPNKKKYALISVFDKEGIVDFAKALKDYGYEIISTGGTAKILKDSGIDVIPIEKITKNPESFDGRMKTISFQIEGGILFDRDNKKHLKESSDLAITPIDMVVCNFYPFEKAINKKGVTKDEVIENIDVGGPTMVRAAAKNFKHVTVVVSPEDYETVLSGLQNNNLTSLNEKLSAKAFWNLTYYDSQIAHYFNKDWFPELVTLPGKKVMDLRYGENPHQKAAFYKEPYINSVLPNLTKHWGRDLSLINLTDINAGIESVRLFKEPSAVVIKHNSPCGIALGKITHQALKRAIEGDSESAFGGIIVLNRKLDLNTAKVIGFFKSEKKGNIDIVAAPNIDKSAVSYLSKVRKSMGIYTFGTIPKKPSYYQKKWVEGGYILQWSDLGIDKSFKDWKVVTKNKPTKKQLEQMKIAWKFLSRIKSNTVIVVDKNIPMTRGIGSGQTSRVKSTKIALADAGKYAKGGLLASDSFFPFDDSVKLAEVHGISAIVQQGGSVRDQSVIDAADKAGISMVFTGRRAFWH